MSKILTVNEIMKLGRSISLYEPLSEIHRAFHQSQKPVKWLFGGNQSGKTYSNMMDLTLTALEINPYRSIIPNGLHWVGIESWEQVRDVLWNDYLSAFIPPGYIYDIIYGQDRVPKKITLINDHVIEFKAFNQGRSLFQARKIDTFHGDEQCYRDFQGIFQEIQARLLVKSGYISWSLTPILPQVFLEDRIDDLPKTDDVFFVSLELNRKSKGGYIPDERIDEKIEDWAEEVQATRIEGKFSSYFGSVYKSFNRRVHIISPFEIPRNWPRYRGFDFGFTNPFVCMWLAKDPVNEVWYVYREYYRARTGIGEHIDNVLKMSGGEEYIQSFADPENAEDRHELRRSGILTKQAKKDVARGIEMVQSKLKLIDGKAKLYVFNTCKFTPKEFMTYKYSQATAQREARDIPIPKNDHCLDAIRYVIYTLERRIKASRILATY